MTLTAANDLQAPEALPNRQEELLKAEEEALRCRHRIETAKTEKAKREAFEDLEFWTNRAAFLAHVRTN